MIDARLLWGSRAIFDSLIERLDEEVFEKRRRELLDELLVDLVQALDRQLGTRGAIGRILVARSGEPLGSAQGDGLTDGIPTGGAHLSHLPEKRPEGQPQGPLTRAGECVIRLLGEEGGEYPGRAKAFELMNRSVGGPVKAAVVAFEVIGPEGKIRRGHGTAHRLSHN